VGEHNTKLRVVGHPAPPEPAPSPEASDDEAELVARSLAGDMRAWGRLYQLHFNGLFRHVCYLTGDPGVGEDLTQETFARALSSLPRFGGRSRFTTWLHGIAINVVRKHRETRRKANVTRERLATTTQPIPQSSALERRHLQRTRAAALCRVLETLPDHLRDAFVLRDLQGLSVPEAAAQLQITEANLRVRACRARAQVHDVLVAEGWIEPPAEGGAR
jgi:RNA polymerase sigma-70 factor (ECF subfamily)